MKFQFRAIILIIVLALLASACNTATPVAAVTPTTAAQVKKPTTPSNVIPSPMPTKVVPTGLPTIPPPFAIASLAFKNDGEIPAKYAYKMSGQCSGENLSPALYWEGAPEGTQSFVLLLIDRDAQNFVHWVAYDIPATAIAMTEIKGGPDTGLKGVNDYGTQGYGGPCPPSGTHHYVFTLYALDIPTLGLEAGATKSKVDAAMKDHIIAKVSLTGLFKRK